MVGNVYLGRIQNVLPGMEAAFVDIGRGRNGVLYAGEVNYSPEDLEGPAAADRAGAEVGPGRHGAGHEGSHGRQGRAAHRADLPAGPLPGPRARTRTSRGSHDGSRTRRAQAAEGDPEQGEAQGARGDRPDGRRGRLRGGDHQDLRRLVALWEQIQKSAKKAKAPAELYEEPELTVRVVRDLFTDEEFRGLVTDSERVYDKVMEYVRDVAPDLESKVTLHRGPLSAFEEHRIVEQIHKALDRKVWLPSGGYLIIEQTEAMTIVDVNTGKAVGKTNLEETVLTTNLEAASEVARQLRLRDIGGIIVIDFIDLLLETEQAEGRGHDARGPRDRQDAGPRCSRSARWGSCRSPASGSPAVWSTRSRRPAPRARGGASSSTTTRADREFRGTREEPTMYAVIKTGGKQHKVQAGDVIEVEKLVADGETVEFHPLLVVDDDGKTIVGAEAAKAVVIAKPLGEKKGEKVKVFKYRPKSGYAQEGGTPPARDDARDHRGEAPGSARERPEEREEDRREEGRRRCRRRRPTSW